jgi:hypothetical protein
MIKVVYNWLQVRKMVFDAVNDEMYELAHRQLHLHSDELIDRLTELYMDGIEGSVNRSLEDDEVIEYMPFKNWFDLYFED